MVSAEREPLHLSNAHWHEDRISVAADTSLLHPVEGVNRYVDRQFGNAWSWTPPPGSAVYGLSTSVPRGPMDNGGPALRVPYRRIPVIDVNSLEEALALSAGNTSKDPHVTSMWRGQPRHYPLARDPLDKLRLYGDPEADEPSLLPSAARQSVYFPDLAEAWCGLLDLYIEERIETLGSAVSPPRLAVLRREAEHFVNSYNYRTWALATAQHYGLPSVGLDLTSDIRIALYFALHRFHTDPETGVMSVQRATEDDDPVLYGLEVFAHDLIEDQNIAPPWLLCARPQAQSAFFFATAWGDSVNRAADRVYVAVRLKHHVSWKSPIKTAEAFPPTYKDDFLSFLLRARERFRDLLVGDLLRRIYFPAE